MAAAAVLKDRGAANRFNIFTNGSRNWRNYFHRLAAFVNTPTYIMLILVSKSVNLPRFHCRPVRVYTLERELRLPFLGKKR